MNRFNEACSFDTLSQAILDKPTGAGACFGTHVPAALMAIHLADALHPVLSPPLRRRIVNYFEGLRSVLEATQHASGAWHVRWYDSPSPRPDLPESYQGVYVTGHHLEWLALCPAKLRPSDAHIERAIAYLQRTIPVYTVTTVSRNYSYFSHACRALCLIAGVRPGDLIEE